MSLPQEGVSFVDGSDGFPAFGIENTADIKVPYSVVLEQKLFEFTITVNESINLDLFSKNLTLYSFRIILGLHSIKESTWIFVFNCGPYGQNRSIGNQTYNSLTQFIKFYTSL